jgi:hypothetical protein
MQTYIDTIQMEEDIIFKCLVIKPGKINTNWHDINYAYKLIEDCSKNNLFELVETNTANFMEILATRLEVNKYNIPNLSVKTDIIGDEYNNNTSYVYDMLYINIDDSPEYKKEENLNELASLLNTNENATNIYSNAIVFRTKLNHNNDSMILADTLKEDIANLLHHRVHTKIVTWDDNWVEQVIPGDLSHFASEFFDDGSIVKIEFPFLMHNINIWYTIFSYGSDPCGKLVNRKIDKCIWFTMKSDEYRGNLTLDEVKKIIFLSEKMSNYATPEKFQEEKVDSMGRKIVYNKYKVLDLVYSVYNNKS